MSIEIAQKYGIGVTYKGDDGGLYFKDEAGNVTSLTQPDQLAKVSSNDTTAGYLEGKLVAGSNVTLTTNNEGGNETLTISAAADNDEKTKVSSNDTTSGYLESKLVAGSNVTLTTNNEGGNETITIAASADNDEKVKVSANDTTSGYIEGKLVAGANVTLTTNNEGGNETLTIDAAGGGLTAFIESQNTASPNDTVNASRLLVDATSTNADIVLQAKGSGAILAQLPDGTTTGGNKRGLGAVDLQMSRTSSGQVANGNYSVIIGGQNNIAGGSGSIAGGVQNTVYGQSAVALGSYSSANWGSSVAIGMSCTGGAQEAVAIGSSANASGVYSFVFGRTSTASGSSSVSIGHNNSSSGSAALTIGAGNAASGTSSIAIGANATSTATYSNVFGGLMNNASAPYACILGGSYAIANRYAMRSFAAGRFASDGDCQEERYVLRSQTTDATQTELSCNGTAPSATTRIGIASDATYTFSALVTARRTDADNESGCWKIEGGIDNNAGTTAFVGTPIVTALGDDSAGVWDVTVDADNTNDALVIKVTGENGKTIRWGATVTLMKVAG